MGDAWPTARRVWSMKLVFLLAVLVFVVTFFTVMLIRPYPHTAGDLSRLQRGMTQDEVMAVLGEPKILTRLHPSPGVTEETWTYSLPASRLGLNLAEYQLAFRDEKLDSWWKVK